MLRLSSGGEENMSVWGDDGDVGPAGFEMPMAAHCPGDCIAEVASSGGAGGA